MRIVDVCAFYTPFGGGVRTYAGAKLRAAARFGHEVIVIAPGERHEVTRHGPGAFLVTIPSPRLPVDGRYRYFDDEQLLHATLDSWQPDHVEASSPWSSATMVGRWQGAASRSLVMHATRSPLTPIVGLAASHRSERSIAASAGFGGTSEVSGRCSIRSSARTGSSPTAEDRRRRQYPDDPDGGRS